MTDHVTVEQCDRDLWKWLLDAPYATCTRIDNLPDGCEELQKIARHRTQANETMREALEHWDAQATCWLESREQHARPGWMQPAIDKGRRALSGDSA